MNIKKLNEELKQLVDGDEVVVSLTKLDNNRFEISYNGIVAEFYQGEEEDFENAVDVAFDEEIKPNLPGVYDYSLENIDFEGYDGVAVFTVYAD
jgi:hypothetical protein